MDPELLSEGVQHQAAVGRIYPLALGRNLCDPGQVSWPPSLRVSVCPVAVSGPRVDLSLLPACHSAAQRPPESSDRAGSRDNPSPYPWSGGKGNRSQNDMGVSQAEGSAFSQPWHVTAVMIICH